MSTTNETNPVELATELTIAWLSNPNTRVEQKDVPAFLHSMHEAIKGLTAPSESLEVSSAEQQEHVPAVGVRKSLGSKDYIISLIDGKPYKTLRRHLAGHGLTPDQYRERYNLKPDYPMVAESYSESRRAMAKKIGLGRKAAGAAADRSASAASNKPARKPRAPKDVQPA